MAENRRGTAPAGGLGARVAAWLLHAVGDPPLRVALWNGDEIGPEEAVGTVRLRDRGALWRLARDPALEAGDLYSEGRIELEGDLVALLRAAYQADLEQGPWRRWLWGMPRNDVRRARANARHHYDVGNEFYSLWLDERMVYTCAYFSHRGDTLEEAQRAKLEHVCRKLDLRPGERVIEVGSGWGALALHMARCHGVTVRAFNVSSEQVAWAREQAEKQGLADRVEFIEDDYRNLTGRCEKFVSVGMLEHVGPRQYPELGAVIDRALEPHGLALLHSIGRSRPAPLQRWIAQRIFPNAHPPTLREMMDVLEPFDFVTLDVENLRLHYALTLRRWLDRYERSWRRIVELVGPRRARAWKLYLAGAVAAFENGSLQLFQLLLSRASNDCIPWTRAHLDTGGPAKLATEAEGPAGGSL